MQVHPCEPCVYAPGGEQGTYYASSQPQKGRVLLLSPLFEEKRAAHRAMAEFSSFLADCGMAVFQPDLYGCGNSPGMLCEASLERWQGDIREGLAYLRQHAESGPICLAGCRMGGLLAALYLSGRPEDASLLFLWNPVASGANYLSSARKRRMIQDSITQAEGRPAIDPLEVEGQVLSKELYEGIQGLSLGSLLPPHHVRLFQCSFKPRLMPELDRLVVQWAKPDRVRVQCVIAEPFWNSHTPAGYEELMRTATEFLLMP